MALPTVMQTEPDAHATPSSPPNLESVRLGVGWIVQLVRFQRTASVAEPPPSGPGSDGAKEAPTAVQVVAPEHDTDVRYALAAPAGFASVWIDHVLPFQFAINPPPSVSPNARPPTATHAVLDVQVTALRSLSSAPLGRGRSSADQRLPFHRATTGCDWPGSAIPTAVQSLLEAHATPFSRVHVTPAGVGIVWIVQLLPFQCSASMWSTWPPPGSVLAVAKVPTATHAVVDAQVTPFS
jgi:hypothetical protein